jgi:hypothetical protein
MKYFGCYLKNFKWTCKKFDSKEDADNFALSNKEKAYATKLLLLNDFIPKCFEKLLLEEKLKFNTKIE